MKPRFSARLTMFNKSFTITALALCGLSSALYALHFFLFHDLHHIFLYLVGDIAFIPLEVLAVTLVFHRVLEERSRKEKLHKLNMLVGVFFSEIGHAFLGFFADRINNGNAVRSRLQVTGAWTPAEFSSALRQLGGQTVTIDEEGIDLPGLKRMLLDKRTFLVQLLENPNLLEYESFSELLMALFHLAEELEWRSDPSRISPNDAQHIAGDINRVYRALVIAWLRYLMHLKKHYPFLFSLAIRLNPFNRSAKAEID